MHAILPASPYAVNSLQPGGEMPKPVVLTPEFIRSFELTWTEDDRNPLDPAYGWIFVNRWEKTKYAAFVKKFGGKKRVCFESDSPEETTRKVKEELLSRAGITSQPLLIPDEDEAREIQLILRDHRESGSKIRLHNSWSLGDRILKTMKNLNLKNDPYTDAIKLGIDAKATLEMGVARFLAEEIDDPDNPPEVKDRTQRCNAKYALQILINRFGGEISLRRLAEEDRGPLIEFYRTEIVRTGKLKFKKSYRGLIRRIWKRFFAAIFEYYGIRLPCSMFERQVMGTTPPVVTPKPAVLWKFVYTILTQYPELLLFVIFQLCFAMRPEEAYRALRNPLQYIFLIDDRFYFPARGGRAKANTKRDRNVRIRPLTRFLLGLVPGLLDGRITDFRVHYRRNWRGRFVSGYYRVGLMQLRVNQILREAGFAWEGSMPDEILRKANLSAQWACKIPDLVIAQEASHSDVDTLRFYIDQTWTVADGIAFWSMVFEGQPPHDPDLFIRYHAFEQERPKQPIFLHNPQDENKGKTNEKPHENTHANHLHHPASQQA